MPNRIKEFVNYSKYTAQILNKLYWKEDKMYHYVELTGFHLQMWKIFCKTWKKIKNLIKDYIKANLILRNSKTGFKVHNFKYRRTFLPSLVALHSVVSSGHSTYIHRQAVKQTSAFNTIKITKRFKIINSFCNWSNTVLILIKD